MDKIEKNAQIKGSKVEPKARSISHKSLRQKMSELISLRERVEQAELAAGVARLAKQGLARSRKSS